MGWSYEYRPKGHTDHEWLSRNVGEGYEVLDSATVGRAWYAAVRTPDGDVRAYVTLIARVRGPFNFGTKDMTEEWGPVETRCPVRILDLLTPTDNEYANEWRKACRTYAARVAAVKRGTRVRLATAIGDAVFEAVDLRRNLFLQVTSNDPNGWTYGRPVHVPWWRSAPSLQVLG